jgi:hypothetical protein
MGAVNFDDGGKSLGVETRLTAGCEGRRHYYHETAASSYFLPIPLAAKELQRINASRSRLHHRISRYLLCSHGVLDFVPWRKRFHSF